jgi:hypothetical protein
MQGANPRQFHVLAFRFIDASRTVIDSVTFVVVAFSGQMPSQQMVLVAFTGWAIMVVWEIAALPLTLPLVRALKRHEGVDYFDIGTNFNPLHF